MTARPGRYWPGRAFPPYAYVPGHSPHPLRDRRGHSHGRDSPPPQAIDPAAWRESADFLCGVDLFNHGYYWEAHEAWEGLWRAYPPEHAAARFLRALIRLSAAGVKAREGRPRGVTRHAAGAALLLEAISEERPMFGLHAGELAAEARRLAGLGDERPATDEAGLDIVLRPR